MKDPQYIQARTQGGFEGVRTNPLFWLGIHTTYVIDSRSTMGLVRRTMARDPRLLANNIIRTSQGIGCG